MIFVTLDKPATIIRTEIGGAVDICIELEAPNPDGVTIEFDRCDDERPQPTIEHKGPQLYLSNVPPGCHRIEFFGNRWAARQFRLLIVAPPTAYRNDDKRQKTALMVQLYAFRSSRNWGVGDFTDLRKILQNSSGKFDFVGINPLHALSVAYPEEASPYAADSRLLLNEIYIDVEKAASHLDLGQTLKDFISAERRLHLSQLRHADYIQYEHVYCFKLAALSRLFDEFITDKNAQRKSFSAFEQGIDDVVLIAVKARANRRIVGKREDQSEKYSFELFLQWLADTQLRSAIANSQTRLFTDLAVGSSIESTDGNAFREIFHHDRTMGAPPDDFAEQGQNWKIAPLNINKARASGYAYFRQILRQNMTEYGMIRIDHILGYLRRYTIPIGDKVSNGGFEDIPLDEFLALIAIESHRKKCMVLGEDLGLVPAELVTQMIDAKVYCSVVYLLEHDAITQGEFDRQRLVNGVCSFGNHDLAPLCSFFSNRDLEILTSLERLPQDRRSAAEKERDEMLTTLTGGDKVKLTKIEHRIELLQTLARKMRGAIYAYSLDDILGETEPINIPGTDKEYPNWRRKYRRAI